jgi:D-xylose transport system substrate-binding protein
MVSRKSGLAAAVHVATLVAAVIGPQVANAKDANGRYVVAVSLQSETEPIWHLWVNAMKAEAEKENATIIVQYANRDPAKQAAQVEQMLAQNPDAFIFNPVNGGTASTIVDEIKDAKIPVVGFDDVVPNSKVNFYVLRNNHQVGILQAQLALKYAPKGNYAFIKGNPIWTGWAPIVKGYDETLKGNPDIKVVFDQNADWDPAKAQSLAENALSASQDNLQAIVVMNDGMATGVTAAVQSRNLAGKVYVSGMDAETQALRAIVNGAQTMTVYTDIQDYSVSAVKAAIMLVKGETPPSDQMTSTPMGDVPTHLVQIVAVTKDNICDVIQHKMIAGWTSVADVFGKADACK